jgi:hypothetical protein
MSGALVTRIKNGRGQAEHPLNAFDGVFCLAGGSGSCEEHAHPPGISWRIERIGRRLPQADDSPLPQADDHHHDRSPDDKHHHHDYEQHDDPPPTTTIAPTTPSPGD